MHDQNEIMQIDLPDNAKLNSILKRYPRPRGASHFRFTAPDRKPVVQPVKYIDLLAGCKGELEFGKARIEGRGKNAKLKEFLPLAPNGAKDAPKAAPAALAAKAATKATLGRHPKVMGHSACAVAKALGKVGVRYDEAVKVMAAQGVKMTERSLRVQLAFGKCPNSWERHGQPAPLSAGQVADLRRGANS